MTMLSFSYEKLNITMSVECDFKVFPGCRLSKFDMAVDVLGEFSKSVDLDLDEKINKHLFLWAGLVKDFSWCSMAEIRRFVRFVRFLRFPRFLRLFDLFKEHWFGIWLKKLINTCFYELDLWRTFHGAKPSISLICSIC